MTTKLTSKIYVINLVSSIDRYNRFNKRWSEYQNNIIYVDAVISGSEETKWALDSYVSDPNKHPVSHAEAACLRSHLKAINMFLKESEDEYCIIMEDDARPHKDFLELYNNINANLDHDLVLLTPYLTSMNIKLELISPLDPNRTSLIPKFNDKFSKFKTTEQTYSTLAYRISRKYAQFVIDNYYYSQFKDIKIGENRITAEHITRFAEDSYSIWPPLCIDEALDTTIQHPGSCQLHLLYNNMIGQESYLPI